MKIKEYSILGYPALVWLMIFILVPVILVVILSLCQRGVYGGIEWGLSLQNYSRIFNLVYASIFFKTVALALLTATACLVIAYPMAWAISSFSQEWRMVFVISLAIPFLTNLIIRVYAIMLFVGMDGPLQSVLHFLGVDFDPYAISQNSALVAYGMVTTYLPFMVLPLYVALEKFDFLLIEAAEDLGASKLQILFQVIVPNTKVAAVNGFILVFIPCLGEFVIPDLLGGAKTMLAGNLITEQFLKTRDWPFGAALSILLIVTLLGLPFLLKRVVLRGSQS